MCVCRGQNVLDEWTWVSVTWGFSIDLPLSLEHLSTTTTLIKVATFCSCKDNLLPHTTCFFFLGIFYSPKPPVAINLIGYYPDLGGPLSRPPDPNCYPHSHIRCQQVGQHVLGIITVTWNYHISYIKWSLTWPCTDLSQKASRAQLELLWFLSIDLKTYRPLGHLHGPWSTLTSTQEIFMEEENKDGAYGNHDK